MTAIAIGWYNAEYEFALHDAAEVDHPSYPHVLCVWIEEPQEVPRCTVDFLGRHSGHAVS
ncbi:hypothetical protein [Rhizobium sp. 28DA2]|uniref:hypothetical protein n=1 Tax=Rhizobium sp. 28DA2 TaxID=3035209 RepID=UPI002B240E09|nr:hypothetical protein [Rhizobium sp. 28DA2]